jgi:hypothetical protein
MHAVYRSHKPLDQKKFRTAEIVNDLKSRAPIRNTVNCNLNAMKFVTAAAFGSVNSSGRWLHLSETK